MAVGDYALDFLARDKHLMFRATKDFSLFTTTKKSFYWGHSDQKKLNKY